jgi:hypothetical protein
MSINSLWATYTLPNDAAYQQTQREALAKRVAEDPERPYEEWMYDLARVHEEARRKATERVLRDLACALRGAPDDLGLQVQLVATDWKEHILRHRYN